MDVRGPASWLCPPVAAVVCLHAIHLNCKEQFPAVEIPGNFARRGSVARSGETCVRADEERVALALPYFQGLSEAGIRHLIAGASLQRFHAQSELIRQGEASAFLHVVVEGRVEVYARDRDRETTVDVLDPGDCFILAAVFLDRPYLKSARALTPVRILLVPAEAVRRVFHEDPVFAEKCAAELAHGYRRLVQEVSNLKLRSSLERLANWLLLQAQREPGSTHFTIPFDKKTLAARLGIAPEVLSRNFAALGAYGVKVSGKLVEVTDRTLLAELAHPEPTIDDPSY
jgi:CRP/FNR family transcriptional activator FtrB